VEIKAMVAEEITTIDAYIAAQPEARQSVLTGVRAAIRAALPEATEVISYKIPAFRHKGRTVIYFAGWKAHYSLYPVGPKVVEAFGEELSGYKNSKGTLKLPLDKPVPGELITRITLYLAQNVEAS
jgi:uncharacterized protein YdhG (YjbR/CyaY superfamily)